MYNNIIKAVFVTPTARQAKNKGTWNLAPHTKYKEIYQIREYGSTIIKK